MYRKSKKNERIIVVVSAFRGVTDQLLEMASNAERGDKTYLSILKQIEERHFETIKKVVPVRSQSDVITELKMLLNELEDVLQGVLLVGELTKKNKGFYSRVWRAVFGCNFELLP